MWGPSRVGGATQPQRRARVVPRRGDPPSPGRTTSGARSNDNRSVPCHGIDGLYSGHEVNIGYRPYRTTRPTAIRDDLPPDRPAAGPGDGWIWVYAPVGATGWATAGALTRG